jgi:hypothetical protein
MFYKFPPFENWERKIYSLIIGNFKKYKNIHGCHSECLTTASLEVKQCNDKKMSLRRVSHPLNPPPAGDKRK